MVIDLSKHRDLRCVVVLGKDREHKDAAKKSITENIFRKLAEAITEQGPGEYSVMWWGVNEDREMDFPDTITLRADLVLNSVKQEDIFGKR
jgi:hypothetical protein